MLSRRALIQFPCTLAIGWTYQDASWRARVTDDKEKGEPLIIRGRVLRSKNGPPAPGASIMVYQTDASGIYSNKSGSPMDVSRLRGRFTSDKDGEYEIVTIRPGPYPDSDVPMHIHVNLFEPGKAPREIFEFFFSGDPRLRGNEKGYILQPRKDAQGTWIAVQDFALEN
jgi:protocatechuate 3,4-dioxygenase beta subunit